MGIEMTGRASVESHVLVACFTSRVIGPMTPFASNLDVRARQWIACFCVVELSGGFPVEHSMALSAVAAELPFVRVGVARLAFRR